MGVAAYEIAGDVIVVVELAAFHIDTAHRVVSNGVVPEGVAVALVIIHPVLEVPLHGVVVHVRGPCLPQIDAVEDIAGNKIRYLKDDGFYYRHMEGKDIVDCEDCRKKEIYDQFWEKDQAKKEATAQVETIIADLVSRAN